MCPQSFAAFVQHDDETANLGTIPFATGQHLTRKSLSVLIQTRSWRACKRRVCVCVHAHTNPPTLPPHHPATKTKRHTHANRQTDGRTDTLAPRWKAELCLRQHETWSKAKPGAWIFCSFASECPQLPWRRTRQHGNTSSLSLRKPKYSPCPHESFNF